MLSKYGKGALAALGMAGALTALPMAAQAEHTAAAPQWVGLEQGWNDDQRHEFWFTSQGSQILPYDWFLALEQANSTEAFRSDANMERLRYITDKADPEYNPDGLPIGFAKAREHRFGMRTGRAWVGFTCAACHTGQVNYKGKAMVVDGAPAMADYSTFMNDLIAALQQTAQDAAKFDRFAGKVLGANPRASKLKALRKELDKVTGELVARNELNKPPRPYGYARLDAFGNIFNQVAVTALGVPGNKKIPDAPVSYPFIWGAPQSDWVQWNGAVNNAGIGPLSRNAGEVIGVFGHLDIKCGTIDPKCYKSTVDIKNLGKLEHRLTTLWAPQWPAAALGSIDDAKKQKGAQHFARYCQTCHQVLGDKERNDPARKLQSKLMEVSVIGSDPKMAQNAVASASTGLLKGKKEGVILGDRFGDSALEVKLLGNAVIGVALHDPLHSIKAIIREKYGMDRSMEAVIMDYLGMLKQTACPDAKTLQCYKARSLDGIWATAPYLHNGSVPSLWELLKPPAQRVKTFYVGSREFDPVNVGFDTAPFPGGFEFDTSLESNHNTGHVWGTTGMDDDEKRELIEYLKSL